jgi:hypothetical protein
VEEAKGIVVCASQCAGYLNCTICNIIKRRSHVKNGSKTDQIKSKTGTRLDMIYLILVKEGAFLTYDILGYSQWKVLVPRLRLLTLISVKQV